MKKSPPNRPGLVLKKIYMDPQQMTVQDLSKYLDISNNSVSSIISGRLAISPDIALKLSKIFYKTTAEYWIELQSAYDLWYAEGNRGSDEPFFQVMKFSGEAILKLIGAKNHVGYEPKAVVLKSKTLSPDIMAVPKNPDSKDERIFIEFQAYREEMIRYLTASKVILSCAQDRYTGPVLSAIIYTDATFMESALPLKIESVSGNTIISGEFKEIVLSELKEKELLDIDPKLVLLAPFATDNKIPRDQLAVKCSQWKSIATLAYPDSMHNQVLNVLSLFILSKYKDISIKEVRAMLNFDLSNTRAGEELIDIGVQKGIQKGRQDIIYSQLRQRFGAVPIAFEHFTNATDEVINSLTHEIFNFSTLDDFSHWWSKNAVPAMSK